MGRLEAIRDGPSAAFSAGLQEPDADVDDHAQGVHRLPLVRVGDAYDLVQELPVRCVDCVVTSPPYWGLRTYGQAHADDVLDLWRRTAKAPDFSQGMSGRKPGSEPMPGYEWYRDNGGVLGREPYPEWYILHLVEIFERLRPALKPSGSLWVNLGDTYFARWSSIRNGRQGLDNGQRTRRRTPSGGWLQDKQLLLIPGRFAIAMQNAGWILRNDLIWSKPDVPPRPEADRLRLSHEHLFHFVQRRTRGRARYYYDMSQVESGGRDVVTVGVRRGRNGHSATFPVDLISPRIASSCRPGGLVVDPFCGTGRTLEVALSLGRLAHGIEISASFAAAARAHARRAHLAGDQILRSESDESDIVTQGRRQKGVARSPLR